MSLRRSPRSHPSPVATAPIEQHAPSRRLDLVLRAAEAMRVDAPKRPRDTTDEANDIINEAIERVSYDGRMLRSMSEELRSNRAVVLAAVQQNGRALEYASDEVQAAREVVLAAVKQNGHAIRFAPSHLRADYEMVLAAVKNNSYALLFASAELQDIPYVVLSAVG